MHIVTAAHDFYPDPGSGGTGRYVYETSRRLAARGHRVSVITRRRGSPPRRDIIDGISVYRYDLAVADRAAPAVLSQLPRAWDDIGAHLDHLERAGPPDLLSAQGPVTSLLVGRRLDAAIPCVATFHSPWPGEYRIRTRNTRSRVRRRFNTAIRWRLERRLLSQAAEVITLSGFMRDELRRTYDLDVHPTVVPGGVDSDQFSPAAASDERLFEGCPVFLTVRRLAERMGHALLFEAFSTVVAQWPNARLVVAGDGPERPRLERLAASLDIVGQTTFLGYVPDPDLPRVYTAADIFVLPTTELEGFGLATLEALASGTPVIATPIGATVEVLSGWADTEMAPEEPLAAAATPEALAARMLAWAGLPRSELDAAGRATRRYAKECYPWDRTVSRVEAIYERVVA